MILVEIGEPSLCRELYDPVQNHQNMTTYLDLLPELREKAQINKEPMPEIVRKGRLSLENGQQCKKEGWQVLRNWDGPYRIREDVGGEAYRLELLLGEEIPNTWNVSYLKFYFS